MWVLEVKQEEAFRQAGMVVSQAAGVLPFCTAGSQDPQDRSASVLVSGSLN